YYTSLNLQELKKRIDAKDNDDGSYVKGRSDHRGSPEEGLSKKDKKKSTGFVKKNARQDSGMHSEGYDNGDLLMVVGEERFLEWIMNSGGSFHMTPRRNFLFDFKEFNGGMVLLGDNRACAIIGTGKVGVQMKDGSSFVLENNGRVKAEFGEASVGIQEKESLAQVWHKRMGHISEAGLHELEIRDMLGKKGLGKLELCENCVLGKSTRGPSRVESISGCRYFLSIVDDYSRRVWVHFLRHKNEAFSKFKEWKQLVENQTSRKLKKLRTNNGLEFCNLEFNNLCKENGVARHLTYGLPDCSGMTQRDVVFNESLMYKDTLKGAGAADSGKEVEFEVELQGSRVKPTVDPHTGENPWNEDEEQDEGPQQQNLDNYVLVRDRENRTITIPTQGIGLKNEWVRAMNEEMSSLKKNHTWELVDQPPGQKLISCKWLYKIKEGIEGVQNQDYELEQLDVKTAFLHGNLEETIYMRQPPSFKEGTVNKVSMGLVRSNMIVGFIQRVAPELGVPNPEGVLSRDTCRKSDNLELIMAKSRLCAIGSNLSLMYLMVCLERTLRIAVSHCEQVLGNIQCKKHWEAVKWIFEVLERALLNVRLVYGRDQGKHVDVGFGSTELMRARATCGHECSSGGSPTRLFLL
ncbi:retrovirus-related pol polyprotein from transposon TNT 1-94, partial [Tanacetum coccineum]